ncbi:MAG: hypothetical protein M3040_11310 [Bacteroidota bacterium]|nr:hypothetical protein [Bacteroidota bacterium]
MTARFLVLPAILLLLLGCNTKNSNTAGNDSTGNASRNDTSLSTGSDTGIHSSPSIKNDSSLLALSNSILLLIKKQELSKLSSFIHPQLGIRFSPYGVVDTVKNQRLSKEAFTNLITNKKAINWGTSAGTGEPITSNLKDYFKKFVYDADFVNAEQKSVNKIVGRDSLSGNIASVYADCNYTQFYFSGFNKKYEGMDWKSLVLVFNRINGQPFLVAIVHDQWKG